MRAPEQRAPEQRAPEQRARAPRPARTGRSVAARPAVLPVRAWRAVQRHLPAGPRAVVAAAALALLLGGAGWALLASPLTRLEEVRVSGVVRTDEAAVRAAAEPQLGTPLLRLDADAVAEGLRTSPYVDTVALVRHWPRSVEVAVTERVPVAAVRVAGECCEVELLDAAGAVITAQREVPPDLPLVAVDVRRAGAAALVAAGEVARALPPPLRADVERVSATTPDDVRLALRGGAEVRWGSAEDSQVKAQVLALLRSRAGDAGGYDVSAPGAPATW